MNLITDTKLINLTSDTATQYNNSSYLSDVVFETKGLLTHDKKIVNVELSLIHAEIPVSFYTVNYTNNQFKIKLGTNQDSTYTIPVGNYNANTLITQIITLINNTNFTIQLNKSNGKLIFSYNTSFLIYTSNTNTIGQILGFQNNLTYSSTSNIITCPYPLNLLGIKKLNITSTEIITSNYSSSMGGMCSLLTSVAVDEPPFGLIIYENKSGIKHLIKNTEINRIDLQISDEYNNLINFNNINWSLLFSLVITYDLNIPMDSNNIVDNLPQLPQDSTKSKSQPNPNLQQLEFLTTNNIN